jgi:S1-C subfamily serine protease
MCRFTDGTQKQAEVVALDDVSDLALLKIKADADKPLTFLKLAEADLPAPGTDCVTLGFPAGSLMNYNMQVTAGTVSSVAPKEEYEVTLTAKATHGNSGGPLVDRHGHVIGIVSAGLTAYNETYGKALSAGQVRKFLAKHTEKYAPATFDPGKPGDKVAALNTEAIYAQASPATLCILLVRGGPEGGK